MNFSISYVFIFATITFSRATEIPKCLEEAIKFSQCCKTPKSVVVEECNEHLKIADESDMKQKLIAAICHDECIFKKKGLVSDEGVMDKEKIVEFWEKEYSQVGFDKIVRNATEFCIDMIKKVEPKMEHFDTKCKPQAQAFGTCIWAYAIKHCPESAYKQSQQCDEMKASMTPIDQC